MTVWAFYCDLFLLPQKVALKSAEKVAIKSPNKVAIKSPEKVAIKSPNSQQKVAIKSPPFNIGLPISSSRIVI